VVSYFDGPKKFFRTVRLRVVEIFAQYLETDKESGYVVLDADLAEQASSEILDEIRELDGTIRARLIYEH
jgi:D-3-phosphoglycerate dehydrogenase